MCLMRVKEEEDYSAPARYKRVSRTRRYSPSPPRHTERTYRRSYVPPPQPAPLPPPVVVEPPPPQPMPAPPPPQSVRPSSRHTSRAPSVRAPSRHSVTRSHYVEVENGSDTSSSSSSSSDHRSRATSHRTRKTARSSKPPPPASEYSMHEREREVRRSRGYSRPRDEYETYRYVDAPRQYGRSSGYQENPRDSEDLRIHVHRGDGRREGSRYRR